VYGTKRKGGATAGRVDTYYRSPAGKLFRSQVSVERFLNGDAEIVKKKTKATPPKPKLPKPRPESKLTYDVRQQSKSLQEQGQSLRARTSPSATKPIQETASRVKTSPSVAYPQQEQNSSLRIPIRAKAAPGAMQSSPPKLPEQEITLRAKAAPTASPETSKSG
jgi:hypothetical protein